MKIIGAALPRSGTMSLKKAFEITGIGKSYHMNEVFLKPDHVSYWREAAYGKLPDWSVLLNGYVSTLDFPSCLFWKELLEAFPEAKVLLVRRDSEDLYQSIKDTIFRMADEGDCHSSRVQLSGEIFFGKFFEGRFLEKNFAVEKIDNYYFEVEEVVPKEKLLVFEVSEGWEPICSFLDKEIPSVDFPRINSKHEFIKRNKTRQFV